MEINRSERYEAEYSVFLLAIPYLTDAHFVLFAYHCFRIHDHGARPLFLYSCILICWSDMTLSVLLDRAPVKLLLSIHTEGSRTNMLMC